MTGLRTRSHQPELMDGDGLADPALHAHCLADLAQVNRLTLAHRPLLRWLRDDWARQPAGAAPLSVLDVGSGHGDLLRAIRQLARHERREVRLTGIDLHPDSTRAARAATPAADDIAFHTTDLFDWFAPPSAPSSSAPRERPDYIVSSQMTHHLDDAQIVAFLRWLEAHARRGWFIADLHRHWFAHLGFRWLARAAGWHRVVRLDGTLSIARSFRPADWHELLRLAAVGSTVEPVPPPPKPMPMPPAAAKSAATAATAEAAVGAGQPIAGRASGPGGAGRCTHRGHRAGAAALPVSPLRPLICCRSGRRTRRPRRAAAPAGQRLATAAAATRIDREHHRA